MPVATPQVERAPGGKAPGNAGGGGRQPNGTRPEGRAHTTAPHGGHNPEGVPIHRQTRRGYAIPNPRAPPPPPGQTAPFCLRTLSHGHPAVSRSNIAGRRAGGGGTGDMPLGTRCTTRYPTGPHRAPPPPPHPRCSGEASDRRVAESDCIPQTKSQLLGDYSVSRLHIDKIMAESQGVDEQHMELTPGSAEEVADFNVRLQNGTIDASRITSLHIGFCTTAPLPLSFEPLAALASLTLVACALEGSAVFARPSLASLALARCTVTLPETNSAIEVGSSLQRLRLDNTNLTGVSALVFRGGRLRDVRIILSEDYAEDFAGALQFRDCPALATLSLQLCWIFTVEFAGDLRGLEELELHTSGHGRHELVDAGLTHKSVPLQKRFPPTLQLRDTDVVECLARNEARGGTPLATVVAWLTEHGRLGAAAGLDPAVLRVAVSRCLQQRCHGPLPPKAKRCVEKGYNGGAAYKLPAPLKARVKKQGLEAVLQQLAGDVAAGASHARPAGGRTAGGAGATAAGDCQGDSEGPPAKRRRAGADS